MTEIVELLDGHVREKDVKDDDPETEAALLRLNNMLTTVGTPAGEEPDAGSVPSFEPDPDDDGGSQADDCDVVPSLVRPEAHGVEDTGTADDGDGGPTEPLAAVSAVEDAVRDAQQRAEAQLTALVERVRQAEAEQHTADLARVTEAAEQHLEQALSEATGTQRPRLAVSAMNWSGGTPKNSTRSAGPRKPKWQQPSRRRSTSGTRSTLQSWPGYGTIWNDSMETACAASKPPFSTPWRH